jgi:hypothetical protein
MVLLRLWRGEVPLEQTFWTWAVLVALPINILTTAGTFVLISMDRPIEAFVVGYMMSIPYNVFALVAVWRSAGRSQETPQAIMVMRIIAVVWLTLLSVT